MIKANEFAENIRSQLDKTSFKLAEVQVSFLTQVYDNAIREEEKRLLDLFLSDGNRPQFIQIKTRSPKDVQGVTIQPGAIDRVIELYRNCGWEVTTESGHLIISKEIPG